MNTLNELIRKELTHPEGPVLASEQADDLVERISKALRPHMKDDQYTPEYNTDGYKMAAIKVEPAAATVKSWTGHPADVFEGLCAELGYKLDQEKLDAFRAQCDAQVDAPVPTPTWVIEHQDETMVIPATPAFSVAQKTALAGAMAECDERDRLSGRKLGSPPTEKEARRNLLDYKEAFMNSFVRAPDDGREAIAGTINFEALEKAFEVACEDQDAAGLYPYGTSYTQANLDKYYTKALTRARQELATSGKTYIIDERNGSPQEKFSRFITESGDRLAVDKTERAFLCGALRYLEDEAKSAGFPSPLTEALVAGAEEADVPMSMMLRFLKEAQFHVAAFRSDGPPVGTALTSEEAGRGTVDELERVMTEGHDHWHGDHSVPLEELRAAKRLAREAPSLPIQGFAEASFSMQDTIACLDSMRRTFRGDYPTLQDCIKKGDDSPTAGVRSAELGQEIAVQQLRTLHTPPDEKAPPPPDYTWILAIRRGLGHTRAACGVFDGDHIVIASTQAIAHDACNENKRRVYCLERAGQMLRGSEVPLVFDTEAVQTIVRNYEARLAVVRAIPGAVSEALTNRIDDLEREQQATEDRLDDVVHNLEQTIAFLDKDRERAGWNQGQLADTLANAVRLIIGTTDQPIITCECGVDEPFNVRLGVPHKDPAGWTCQKCGGFIPKEQIEPKPKLCACTFRRLGEYHKNPQGWTCEVCGGFIARKPVKPS